MLHIHTQMQHIPHAHLPHIQGSLEPDLSLRGMQANGYRFETTCREEGYGFETTCREEAYYVMYSKKCSATAVPRTYMHTCTQLCEECSSLK